MKKISNILIVLGILAATFVVTGCGVMDRTYNTWYKYEHTGDLSLPIANAGKIDPNGSDEASNMGNGMLENAELYVKFNDTDGLTVCVITKTQQTVSCFGGAYEIQGVDMVAGGQKTYSTKEFGPLKWEALIRLGSFTQEDPPAINVNISQALEGKLNLKRILAEFILNNLLA